MSASLKRLRKQLLSIKVKSNDDLYIKALDGLYLIDFKKDYDDIKVPITSAPEGVEMLDIEANIEDIIVCGGIGVDTVILVDSL